MELYSTTLTIPSSESFLISKIIVKYILSSSFSNLQFDRKDIKEADVIGAVLWSDRGEMVDAENEASSDFG